MYFTIFIGNLSYHTTNEELFKLITPFGRIISCKIIEDRFTLKSKGFAHLEVENKEIANEIIRDLNGVEFNGRPLKIEYFKNAGIPSNE